MNNKTALLDISTKKYPNTYTLVDADMYEELNKYKWYKNSTGYATRMTQENKKKKSILMHRVIMSRIIEQSEIGMFIDHINHNPLDNRRCNLRICTHVENMRNRKIAKNNTSGQKGVSWHKTKKKWMAQVVVNQKHYNFGYYHIKEQAAVAYNIAVKKLYKEFAYLNQVPNEAEITLQIQDKVEKYLKKIS